MAINLKYFNKIKEKIQKILFYFHQKKQNLWKNILTIGNKLSNINKIIKSSEMNDEEILF